MRIGKQAVAIVAGLIGMAAATPGAAVPDVDIFGPSTIAPGETLKLGLGKTGEGVPVFSALQVEITDPSGAFGNVLGDLDVKAAGNWLPGQWLLDWSLSATGDVWTIFATDLQTFTTASLPDGNARLLALSFPVLQASSGPVVLSFDVDFDDGRASTRYAVAINAVPEPGTFVLLIAGLGIAALFRRSRRPA